MKIKKKTLVVVLVLLIAVAAVAAIAVSTGFGSGYTVCIDAGHGGKDDGASSGDRLEKDDNLNLARAVRKELKSRGIKVVMTRNSDEFISLEDRCKTANRRKADIFVSLHRNSAESSGANGFEIWAGKQRSDEEVLLSENILSALESVGISTNRGVKYGYAGSDGDDYYVNSNTNMPSCLVELGFISSSTDNNLFDSNLDGYASAIADAVVRTLASL